MRTLIVTGATRGLGRHIGRQAHECGYRVIGLARRPDDDLPFETRACDVSDHAQVRSVVRDLRGDESLYGLINAAGIASMNLVLTTPPETMERLVATNLLGTMYCCQLVGRMLARRKRGRIINVSTIAVPLALAGEAAYVASKAGVEAFSRVLAREMAAHGVRVNTIAPGPIDTDMIAGVDPETIERIVQRQIVPQKATLDDVWRVVEVLLRSDVDMISGNIIHVGGV